MSEKKNRLLKKYASVCRLRFEDVKASHEAMGHGQRDAARRTMLNTIAQYVYGKDRK